MILEARMGRQLLGKERKPLDVRTMQQGSRRATMARGRERADRLARSKPVYAAPTDKEARRAMQAKRQANAKAVQGQPGEVTKSAVKVPSMSRSSSSMSGSESDTSYHKRDGARADASAAIRAGMFRHGAVSGTPLHMAPEQIRGESEPKKNRKIPNVPKGGKPGSSRWLTQVTGRASVSCKDPKTGDSYTRTKGGCAKGHDQMGRRELPRIKPAVRKPAMPAPVRTVAARRASLAKKGSYQTI